MSLEKWSSYGFRQKTTQDYAAVSQLDVEAAPREGLLPWHAQHMHELEEKRRLSVVPEQAEDGDEDSRLSNGGDTHHKVSMLDHADLAAAEDMNTPLPSRRRILLRNCFYVALNVVSSISITFVNRAVVANPQLKSCQISFAMYHFLTTFLVLFISTFPPFNLFPRLRLPLLKILPLAALFAGFLILGNLSLELNSIEFYILARMMTCPCVVLLQWILLRQRCSAGTLASVALLTVGVVLANGQFGWTHPLGAAVAVAGFTVTAAYQVSIQKKLKDLKCSPLQLLLNQAPVTLLLLVGIVPLFDRRPDLAQVPPEVWVALFTSGFIASLINVSQFLIIGATSALTFNVIGVVKIIVVLIVGWSIDQSPPGVVDISGIVLALAGTWLYAISAASAASQKPKPEPVVAPASFDGGSRGGSAIADRFSEDSVDNLDALHGAEIRELPPVPMPRNSPAGGAAQVDIEMALGATRSAPMLDAPVGRVREVMAGLTGAASRVGELFKRKYTAL